MSDLQIWLLIIGAAIVVALLLFNWMQERRFRKQADAAIQALEVDALMQPNTPPRDGFNRVEPALHESDTDHLNQPTVVNEPRLHLEPAQIDAGRIDEVVAPATPLVAPRTVSAPEPAPRTAVPATAPAYDELIEYRVRIGSDGASARAFADAFNHVRALGKPVRWSGLPVGAAEWEDIQPWRDALYQQVVVTMQLADRNGAVQEEQLNAVCSTLTATAQSNGLRIACDDVVEALTRAQAIDQFCVDVDVLIGLNIVARGEGTVNLKRIVREAEGSGMVLGVDGVFQLQDSRSEPLYALCNHDAEPFSAEVADGQVSQGVTLQFDVPRVPDGLKVFDGMVAFGRKLAHDVGGILVDDNLRPLTDAGIEKIRTQLTQIYTRMEARGVPSGSRRALRLFT